MAVGVLIQPVGAVDISDLIYVKEELARRFPVRLDVTVSMWPLQLPISAFNWSRMQYRADLVNSYVSSRLSGLIGGSRFALAIVGADGYVEGLNFVFGLASRDIGVASVYVPRLRLGADQALYRLRLLKESMHELGHLLGLEHCDNPRCVMSFSNSLDEVDRKDAAFCDRCALKLARAWPRA